MKFSLHQRKEGWFHRKCSRSEKLKKLLAFRSLIRTLALLKVLSLEKGKENKLFFCILLVYPYLCTLNIIKV